MFVLLRLFESAYLRVIALSWES